MKSLRVDFQNGRASVDFNREVSGIDILVPRTVAAIFNTKGSDRTHPTRGTSLGARLAGSAMGPVGVQHECNFAMVGVAKYFRTEVAPDAASAFSSARMVVTGPASGDRRHQVMLIVTNAAGETAGTTPVI